MPCPLPRSQEDAGSSCLDHPPEPPLCKGGKTSACAGILSPPCEGGGGRSTITRPGCPPCEGVLFLGKGLRTYAARAKTALISRGRYERTRRSGPVRASSRPYKTFPHSRIWASRAQCLVTPRTLRDFLLEP